MIFIPTARVYIMYAHWIFCVIFEDPKDIIFNNNLSEKYDIGGGGETI